MLNEREHTLFHDVGCVVCLRIEHVSVLLYNQNQKPNKTQKDNAASNRGKRKKDNQTAGNKEEILGSAALIKLQTLDPGVPSQHLLKPFT